MVRLLLPRIAKCLLVAGVIFGGAGESRARSGPLPVIAERPRATPRPYCERLGRVIPPNPCSGWRAGHCGMCSALPRPGGGYRVWVTGREPCQRGYCIGWVDLDKDLQIVAESPEPCLRPTFRNTFDAQSVFMPSVIDCGTHLRMYYVGEAPPESPGHLNHRPGLAHSTDGGLTWVRFSDRPRLDLDAIDRDGIGTHCVWLEGTLWRMIYTSVIGRDADTRRYVLRYAESRDGIHWVKPEWNVALGAEHHDTDARPCVFRMDGRYLMTYTFRQHAPDGTVAIGYRIRLAESQDGRFFRDVGQILDVAPTGWDSEMCEYGWLVPGPEKSPLLMLYSGNDFGRTGIGAARLTIPARTPGSPGTAGPAQQVFAPTVPEGVLSSSPTNGNR